MDRVSRKQCRHKPADGTPQPGEHTECDQATRPEGLEHPVEHILHPFQYNDYIRDSVVFHFHPARLRKDSQRLDKPDSGTHPSFRQRAGRRCGAEHEPLFPRAVIDCAMRRSFTFDRLQNRRFPAGRDARVIYRRAEPDSVPASDRPYPDGHPQPAKVGRDRTEFLDYLRFGIINTRNRTMYPGFIPYAAYHGKSNGTESGHHPSFALHLGNFVRFYRLNHRITAHNALSVLL